jgi:hypothetical protein
MMTLSREDGLVRFDMDQPPHATDAAPESTPSK